MTSQYSDEQMRTAILFFADMIAESPWGISGISANYSPVLLEYVHEKWDLLCTPQRRKGRAAFALAFMDLYGKRFLPSLQEYGVKVIDQCLEDDDELVRSIAHSIQPFVQNRNTIVNSIEQVSKEFSNALEELNPLLQMELRITPDEYAYLNESVIASKTWSGSQSLDYMDTKIFIKPEQSIPVDLEDRLTGYGVISHSASTSIRKNSMPKLEPLKIKGGVVKSAPKTPIRQTAAKIDISALKSKLAAKGKGLKREDKNRMMSIEEMEQKQAEERARQEELQRELEEKRMEEEEKRRRRLEKKEADQAKREAEAARKEAELAKKKQEREEKEKARKKRKSTGMADDNSNSKESSPERKNSLEPPTSRRKASGRTIVDSPEPISTVLSPTNGQTSPQNIDPRFQSMFFQPTFSPGYHIPLAYPVDLSPAPAPYPQYAQPMQPMPVNQYRSENTTVLPQIEKQVKPEVKPEVKEENPDLKHEVKSDPASTPLAQRTNPPPPITRYNEDTVNKMRITIGDERGSLTADDELLIFEFLSGGFDRNLITANIQLNEKIIENTPDGIPKRETLTMMLDYAAGKWKKLRKRAKL
ncbi:hypothetical protein HK098_006188 [Nowakowskiella sp. JEL0407]|nr:hypothetical protein HK098_006188 [Nowakowskiella sp. JEL0407]